MGTNKYNDSSLSASLSFTQIKIATLQSVLLMSDVLMRTSINKQADQLVMMIDAPSIVHDADPFIHPCR